MAAQARCLSHRPGTGTEAEGSFSSAPCGDSLGGNPVAELYLCDFSSEWQYSRVLRSLDTGARPLRLGSATRCAPLGKSNLFSLLLF